MDYKHITPDLELQYGIWTTATHSKIYIQNMEESYIINCIRRLKIQNDDFSKKWVDRFQYELSMRDIDMSEGWRLKY